MAGFYSARSETIPPLPWPNFAPPFPGDHRAKSGDKYSDQAEDHGTPLGPEGIDLVQGRHGEPEEWPEKGKYEGETEAHRSQTVASRGARKQPDRPTRRLRRQRTTPEEQSQIAEQKGQRGPAKT
ncbi:hypothetical protein [Rhodobacter xanthinilyticus]|uniref:hypothetical protein n=1 Tax=Rhodobacter xanthinilyticus TaxID=1850250 RepID=UPI0018DD65FA|nr:hypothetical protein [Rhodobacter xanthinilyticus]